MEISPIMASGFYGLFMVFSTTYMNILNVISVLTICDEI